MSWLKVTAAVSHAVVFP